MNIKSMSKISEMDMEFCFEVKNSNTDSLATSIAAF